MTTIFRCLRVRFVGSLLAGLAVLLPACVHRPAATGMDADAIVVGAGLSGLSAAVEMGRSGVRVLVVDENSVAGGHAVLALNLISA